MERYIGVSGVATREDQWKIEEIVKEIDLIKHDELYIMSGVQATNKTVRGTPNKYGPLWHPVGDQLTQAGSALGQHVFPFVHVFAEVYHDLSKVIQLADRYTAQYRSGWQLNLLPLHTEDISYVIEQLRSDFPRDIIVLQCHKAAMQQLGPEGLRQELEYLKPHYALIDASHGTGAELEVDKTGLFVESLVKLPEMGTVVAGGLGPDTVYDKIKPLLEINPLLSWDAESNLRTVDPTTGYKILDMLKVCRYLEESKRLLTSVS
jgi:hypothetical protein